MNCRSFLALLAACACFACAPNLATRGPAPQVPAIENGDFIARDGLRLPLRHWDAQNPKAVIVALHGMSDYSEAFDMPGPWWAFNGIAVYAYDQRGFGGDQRNRRPFDKREASRMRRPFCTSHLIARAYPIR